MEYVIRFAISCLIWQCLCIIFIPIRNETSIKGMDMGWITIAAVI